MLYDSGKQSEGKMLHELHVLGTNDDFWDKVHGLGSELTLWQLSDDKPPNQNQGQSVSPKKDKKKLDQRANCGVLNYLGLICEV